MTSSLILTREVAGWLPALISALDDYASAHGGGTLRWITASNNDRARRLYDTLATATTWVTYEREVGQ
jgi:hypothetical protein